MFNKCQINFISDVANEYHLKSNICCHSHYKNNKYSLWGPIHNRSCPNYDKEIEVIIFNEKYVRIYHFIKDRHLQMELLQIVTDHHKDSKDLGNYKWARLRLMLAVDVLNKYFDL